MIYTRHGNPIEIIGNCGDYQPPYLLAPNTLVKVKFLGERPAEDFRFAFYLKADGGYAEIQQAVAAAPVLTLYGPDLQDAFRRAR